MEKIVIIMFSLISFQAFSAGCEEYSLAAISCYENGHLSSTYDETGENCGKDMNFWDIAPSSNNTIKSEVLSENVLDYMGGTAWESECSTTFINSKGQWCNFIIYTSLGTEDADVSISDFMCR